MKKMFTLSVFVLSVLFSQTVFGLTYTVTVPEGTNECYIGGWPVGGWGNFEKMDKVDATTYTIILDNAIVGDTYKYFSGPGYSYEEAIDADGTSLAGDRTWTEMDVVAFWKEVYVPQPDELLTFDVWVPNEVQEVHIVGEFNGWSGNFDDKYKMSYVGDEDGGKLFSIELLMQKVEGMEFEFAAGPGWAYEQDTEGVFTLSDADAYEPNKYKYRVEKFKDIFDPSRLGVMTIVATVPAGTEQVWINGSLFGWDWDNPDAMEMTKNDDGTFSYTTPLIESMQYRLYKGAGWDFPEQEYNSESGEWKERADRTAHFINDGAEISIRVCKWAGDEDGEIDCEASTATNVLEIKQFTVSVVDGTIVLDGSFSRVSLFDVMGRRIESVHVQGAYSSQTLPNGLYLMVVDGVSEKVLVR